MGDDVRRVSRPLRSEASSGSIAEQLRQGSVWNELWNELHHQGDLGVASYAVVPPLVEIQKTSAKFDWNFYALVSTIEIEWHRKTNPPIPDWLVADYRAAWDDLSQFAWRDLNKASDPLTRRAILGAMALSKGLLKWGALLVTCDESDLQELLDTHLAWSKLYRE